MPGSPNAASSSEYPAPWARAQVGQHLGGATTALGALGNWFAGQAQRHQLVAVGGVEVL